MLARGVRLTMVLVVLIVLLAIGAGVQAGNPVPVGPNPVAGAPGGSGITATAADAAATDAAWASAEARAGAMALPLPEALLDGVSDGAAETFGPAGFSPTGAPNPQADAAARQEFPEAWQALDESAFLMEGVDAGLEPAAADGAPGVYISFLGNFHAEFWKTFPFRTVGKLYFQDQANRNYYCTASVISSKNIIVTAAHCLHDTINNRWYKNWVFIPADRNGAAPYGSFNWAAAQVLPAWIALAGAYNLNWAKHDVGLIKLANNAAGKGVTFYTGWMGRSWNFSCPIIHTTIGYPSNLWGGGKYTHINIAECYSAGADVFGQGSNFKGGAGGSPWIRLFTPMALGAGNFVNSVQSSYATTSDNTYGPRFTTNNIVWLCAQAIVLC